MELQNKRQGLWDGILGIGLLLSALALMCYPQEAMEGVRSGLTLCYNVIIPSLFPFFVLSTLVVDLGLAGYLGRALEPIMRPLFRVPGACGSAFALGFIGGYPVGAKTALDLYEKGHCTKVEAERLLSFCNNSGPAFILGVVGTGIFASSAIGLTLYLCHIAASIAVGLLFRFYGTSSSSRTAKSSPRFEAQRFSVAFTNGVKGAFFSTLNICAFVTFFTVVIQLLFLSGILPGLAQGLGTVLGPLGFSPLWAQKLLTGLIELSSGVWSLGGEGSLTGRMSMAAFLLGWAGLSVHCQVLSFLGRSGLSTRTYFVGKLLHGGFSALFTSLVCRLFSLETPVGAYLAHQVDTLAGRDFATTLLFSSLTAWALGLTLLLCARVGWRKTSGKKKKAVV